MEVAELFARLGFRIDASSMARANSAIQGVGKALGGIMSRAQSWGRSLGGTLATAAAGYGFGKLVTTGLKFNSSIEEARNQIAGMLALTQKTDLNDQLGTANTLMDNLRARANKLPGTTSEYIQMLTRLAQPITDAGLGLKDLEDLTVNSVVGAKALGVEWDVAARDIDQALRGQFHSIDQFTGKLLGSRGFKGEEGRSRFNAMTPAERAAALKDALMQKQLGQLAAAQGQTASGKFSTFMDTMQQTLGKATAPLFAQLVKYLEKINVWLDKNQDKVKEFASTVGGVLVTALEAVVEAIKFLVENPELAIFLAAVLGGLLLLSSPLLMIVAGVTLFVLAIKKLGPMFEAMRRAAVRAFDWIGGKVKAIKDFGQKIIDGFAHVWAVIKQAADDAFEYISKKARKIPVLGWLGEKIGHAAARAAGGSAEGADVTLQEQSSIDTINGVRNPFASMVPPGGFGAGNNSMTVTAPITVTGVSDPKAAATAMDQKLRQTMSDAFAGMRGGRK